MMIVGQGLLGGGGVCTLHRKPRSRVPPVRTFPVSAGSFLVLSNSSFLI